MPGYNDSPERCFKLPFVACEALTSSVPAIKNALFKEGEATKEFWDTLFSFFTKSDPSIAIRKEDQEKLNHTLGGYINKVVTFWLK